MSSQLNIIPHENVYAFMMGGRAVITFYNPVSNKQYTYSISRQKSSADSIHKGLVFWVETRDDLIGYIRGDVYIEFFKDSTARVRRMDAINAFRNMWKLIVNNTIPKQIQIIHDGKCSYCRKPLRSSTSLASGLGPECAKKLGITSPLKTTT